MKVAPPNNNVIKISSHPLGIPMILIGMTCVFVTVVCNSQYKQGTMRNSSPLRVDDKGQQQQQQQQQEDGQSIWFDPKTVVDSRVESRDEGVVAFHRKRVAPAMCSGQCIGDASAQPDVLVRTRINNIYTCDDKCSFRSTCFLGTCLCHPGYAGERCEIKMKVANPYYTKDCPNLQKPVTLDLDVPVEELGGKVDCPDWNKPQYEMGTGVSYCAKDCYHAPSAGVPIVPFSIWRAAQQVGPWDNKGNAPLKYANDNYQDYWDGFQYYGCITRGLDLGDVAEFGAGPWTQINGLLHLRPDLNVKSYTAYEPNAARYIEHMHNCVYRTGRLRKYNSHNEYHPFPINIIAVTGEDIMQDSGSDSSGTGMQYDTVMVVNVIEHIQNAPKFLSSVHYSVKPGGLLIFHDRYYDRDSTGRTLKEVVHPMMVTKRVLDLFLEDFDIIFNNCNYYRKITHNGYFIIARKRL